MSLPTEIGPVSDAFARRYGQQGESLLTLASDLFPVVNLGDGEQPAEMMLLQRQLRFSAFRTLTPAAGEFAIIGLLNPVIDPAAPAQLFCVVERIILHSGTTGPVNIISQVPGAVSGLLDARGLPWDNRVGSRRSQTLIGDASVAVAPLDDSLFRLQLVAGVQQVIDLRPGFVLTPSNNFIISQRTADASLTASVFWRERPMTTWELRE